MNDRIEVTIMGDTSNFVPPPQVAKVAAEIKYAVALKIIIASSVDAGSWVAISSANFIIEMSKLGIEAIFTYNIMEKLPTQLVAYRQDESGQIYLCPTETLSILATEWSKQ